MNSNKQSATRERYGVVQNHRPSLLIMPKTRRFDSKQVLLSSKGRSIAFTLEDATAGVENELQAVVFGKNYSVDLPRTVRASNYFKNVIKKAKSGDSPKQVLTSLEKFLETNDEDIWENSWVRFPEKLLTEKAREIFKTDLLADKNIPAMGRRSDAKQFSFVEEGDLQVRIPISYLLKIALADATNLPETPKILSEIAGKLMEHFLSDNTSPEIISFYTTPLTKKFNKGKGIAEETLLRYLTCQLLIQYANKRFGLTESGQTARIYFAPNPPLRQKKLNELISDSYYRELFMSPCLSGWDKGKEKHEYMGFCHRVL